MQEWNPLCIIQPCMRFLKGQEQASTEGQWQQLSMGRQPQAITQSASSRGWEGGISARLSRLGLARAQRSWEGPLACSLQMGRGWDVLRLAFPGSNSTQSERGRPWGTDLAAHSGSKGMEVHSLCTSFPLQPSCRTGLSFQTGNMVEKGQMDGRMDLHEEGGRAGEQTQDQLGDTLRGSWVPAEWLVPTCAIFC